MALSTSKDVNKQKVIIKIDLSEQYSKYIPGKEKKKKGKTIKSTVV